MNFFKTVFADESESESELKSPNKEPDQEDRRDPDPAHAATSAWSFGGLIKTLTTQSESVIETYRRDLAEFGSGLKKEFQVAHGSLETVSHGFDELSSSVIKGTARIISHGKDAILAVDYDSDENNGSRSNVDVTSGSSTSGLSTKRYSRFEAQLRVIQGDEGTYCEDPEDLEDYRKWKSGFDLSEKRAESEKLVGENGVVSGFYKKVVPGSVDEETFWCRYFYRVWKLEQAEALRVSLVRRAISKDEEELSWDVDDEEEEEEEVVERVETRNNSLSDEGSARAAEDDERSGVKEIVENERTSEGAPQQNISVDEVKGREGNGGCEESRGGKILTGGNNVASENVEIEDTKDEEALGTDEKLGSEGKGDNGGSPKDSEYSVVSSNQSTPEEDLGWDEIEDLSSIDERQVSDISSQNKVDLRKRLSVVEEDEDLSWDIEDDDHAKA